MWRTLPILLMLTMLPLTVALAEDDDGGDEDITLTNNPFETQAITTNAPQPVLPPWSNQPLQWTIYYNQLAWGANTLQTVGVLDAGSQDALFGDELGTAMMRQSITYRYHGLLGGVVRPVARFTVGAGQTPLPLSGVGFHGYNDIYSGYAYSELGVEVVYKGVGVGYTYGYLVSRDLGMANDADITGPPSPFAPMPGSFNFDDWLNNFYLIFE
ncbi:MAG TPA: hypothetical protein PKW95_02385 [bacterium]|nr:hypothetical protein [bacterium]